MYVRGVPVSRIHSDDNLPRARLLKKNSLKAIRRHARSNGLKVDAASSVVRCRPGSIGKKSSRSIAFSFFGIGFTSGCPDDPTNSIRFKTVGPAETSRSETSCVFIISDFSFYSVVPTPRYQVRSENRVTNAFRRFHKKENA